MTGNECIIRKVRESDLDEIFLIEEAAFSSPWSPDSLRNELSTSFSHFIAAECDGHIGGYAVAWEISGEIQLNHIAVIEKFRRRGIGRDMVNYLSGMLKQSGAQRILLEVRLKNIGAREFYRALGFIENGLRKNYYYDDDAVLMEKLINHENKPGIFS